MDEASARGSKQLELQVSPSLRAMQLVSIGGTQFCWSVYEAKAKILVNDQSCSLQTPSAFNTPLPTVPSTASATNKQETPPALSPQNEQPVQSTPNSTNEQEIPPAVSPQNEMPVWEERWSKSRNRVYYVNKKTGVRQWVNPGVETLHKDGMSSTCSTMPLTPPSSLPLPMPPVSNGEQVATTTPISSPPEISPAMQSTVPSLSEPRPQQPAQAEKKQLVVLDPLPWKQTSPPLRIKPVPNTTTGTDTSNQQPVPDVHPEAGAPSLRAPPAHEDVEPYPAATMHTHSAAVEVEPAQSQNGGALAKVLAEKHGEATCPLQTESTMGFALDDTTPEEDGYLGLKLEKVPGRPYAVVQEISYLIDINSVIQGQPGYANELVTVGDLLLKIDNQDITHKPLEEILMLLRGKCQTGVLITLMQTNSGKVYTVLVLRHRFRICETGAESRQPNGAENGLQSSVVTLNQSTMDEDGQYSIRQEQPQMKHNLSHAESTYQDAHRGRADSRSDILVPIAPPSPAAHPDKLLPRRVSFDQSVVNTASPQDEAADEAKQVARPNGYMSDNAHTQSQVVARLEEPRASHVFCFQTPPPCRSNFNTCTRTSA